MLRILGSLTIILALHAPAPSMAQEKFSRDSWIEDGRRVEVEVEWEVEYTDDSRAVESLDPGSRFELLEERPGAPSRRVELRPGTGGTIERSYWVDGAPHAFDASAEEWFRDLLEEVIRRRSSNSTSASSSSSSSVTIEPPTPPVPPRSLPNGQ